MDYKEIKEHKDNLERFDDWGTEKGQSLLRLEIALALWEIAAALRDAEAQHIRELLALKAMRDKH
ncbi:hypothetical protein LCGC14_0892240 [marine sediment metagenome]|uniref:Uncharacterized protein n=1 Tax=marine sediment metagenome TaxID=412755 RepID=A0A0F9RI71_9ZZZZ